MTTLASRSFNSAMIASLSKALSAISPPNSTPSIKGGDAHSVEAMARQELKANEIAERHR